MQKNWENNQLGIEPCFNGNLIDKDVRIFFVDNNIIIIL